MRDPMLKKSLALLLAGAVALVPMAGCSGGDAGSGTEQVVIYSNADDEAVQSMEKTLDANGYAGQYIFQSFGTSELGGRLLAEGSSIEADIVTMSTYYLDSAQDQYGMFLDLTFPVNTLEETPSCYAPFLANQGPSLSTPRSWRRRAWICPPRWPTWRILSMRATSR